MNRKCFYCQSDDVMRIHRERWMHWLPGCKKYFCRTCYGEFFVLLKSMTIGLKAGCSKLIKLNN